MQLRIICNMYVRNIMLRLYKSNFDYKISFVSDLDETRKNRYGSIRETNIDPSNDFISSSYYRAKSTILDYAKNNNFNYFATITIDDTKFDINQTMLLKRSICKYFNNIKNRLDKAFKYIMVAEKGSENNRLHYHALIYLENTNLLKHIGHGIYRNEKLFQTFGANQFKKINDYNIKCANYISKYIGKDLQEREYKYSYFCSKGLKRSKLLTSIDSQTIEMSAIRKQLDFIYKYLSLRNLVQDYQFCSVACLSKQQFMDILKECYFNPNFQSGFLQLSFNDLIN